MKNSLKQKSDSLLVSDLKSLILKERELLTEILTYLKEVESRKLFLARGYSSLFAFLIEELGYSESAAQRRIQAMRLIRDLPEVQAKIATGKLSLSVASQVQGFIQKEDQKRKEERQERLTVEEKIHLVEKLEGTSARECEKKLVELSPELNLPKEKIKPITPEKTLIQFLANPELLKKLNRLKSIISHQNPQGNYAEVFEKALDIALEKLDPERRQIRRLVREEKRQIPTGLLPTSAATPANRHIPMGLRDQIWVRDQGKCQYKDPWTGKICGSSHLLEIDHRYAFALGGEHSENNLRLRCRKHNQFRAEMAFEN